MCADTPAPTAAPDYKDTLFLPDTSFPMRAGLPQREPEWLDRWARIGIYDRLRERAAGRAPFILHDGPPYANGNLHIGHALNKVLKDFIVRSQQMLGHDARYVPGWDCHGLPIEWKIEEQYRARGLNKDEVDTVAFRQECRRFAEHWIGVQRAEFQRLGITGAWDRPYLTMDYHAEAVIADEFMKFLMNGSLYQGSKPVMWSPVEKTALAEAEVEYHEVTSHQVWVKFKVAGTQTRAQNDPFELVGAHVVIWTTTPWTIPSNKAIAFSPSIGYGVYEITDNVENNQTEVGERLILADKLAAEVLAKAAIKAERIANADPAAIKRLLHPLEKLDPHWSDMTDGEIDPSKVRPMLAADFVTDDTGTGFVHCAPSHGDEDYELFVKNRLTDRLTYNVEPDGSYRADLPLFGGQHIITPDGKEGPANVSVIKALHGAGALLAKGRFKHSYPHSWRSKAPVIYRNTPQWFAAIDKPLADGMGQYGDTIRQRALTSIDQLVHWTPQTGRNRLHSMIEARPDWVLSRQRAWGVPLTCFTKRGAKPTDPDFLLRDPAVNARIKAAFESEGADVWYVPGFKEKVLTGLHDPDAYEQIFDILDVWFDSGSTHAFVLRDRADGAPDGIANLYLEGTDQHRGWFHSSLLQACGTKGRAPYRGVLTHGFTLDEKGMKMSKSLGNTVAPQQVIDEYGADILRLWVAQSDYTVDLRIGKEILKGTADSYRRLRNTLRYMLGALHDWDGVAMDRADMPDLEQLILHRLAELDAVVRKGFAAYDFQGVFQAIFTFATSDLSAFYFDVRKDALYCDPVTSTERRACLTVMDALFHRLTLWLAPILPFTMEDVWLARFPSDSDSVHLHDFPATPADWLNPDLAARMARVRMVRRVVTGALEVERRAKTIGASLEAAPVVHVTPDLARDIGAARGFATLCITSGLVLTTDPAPEGAFVMDDVPGVGVVFHAAEGEKCQRCWMILPDVGTHSHPGTCARCDATLG